MWRLVRKSIFTAQPIKNFTVKIDEEAEALYIETAIGACVRTQDIYTPYGEFLIDQDENGMVLGIELLAPPISYRYGVSDDDQDEEPTGDSVTESGALPEE